MDHNSHSTAFPFTGRTSELKVLKEFSSKPGFYRLSGRKGLGRTALLKQFANQYSGNKQYKVFYVDLSDAVTPESFILSFAAQTLNVAESGQVKQLRELSNYFTYLRPVINFNRISGVQQMEFTLDANYKSAFTLEQLFSYLSRQAAKVIVILDDCHQIQYFRDPKFLAALSEILKQNGELRIIASVAENRRFSQWLNNSELQYFKEASVLELLPPEHDEFCKAIIEWSRQNGKKLSADVVDQLIEWCRNTTALTLKMLHTLMQAGTKQPDAWYLENMLLEYLQSQRDIFHTYRRLMTSNQWLLLRGIARERGAKLVMGGEFVRKYGLGSPSSVQTALDALYDKELIYEEDGRLFSEDVALSRWLELT
jgi:hypothetical protein